MGSAPFATNTVVTSAALRIAAICLILGTLYYPGVAFHWADAQDFYTFGNDARQYLPAFDKYGPEQPVPTDYIKEYYLNALMLPGYRSMYIWATRLCDPRMFGVLISYVLYAVFMIAIGAVAWRVGGATTCLATLALALSTPYFFQWGFSGGTSRMFAFPVLALALWALAYDRPIALAAITAAGAWFYPLASAISGVAMALWWLILPARWRGSVAGWSLRARTAGLLCTVAVTLVAIAPTLSAAGDYGRRVVPSDLENFPEASAQGRYQLTGDALPYQLFDLPQVISYFCLPLLGSGDPFGGSVSFQERQHNVMTAAVLLVGAVVLFILVRGLKMLLHTDPAASRALALPAAVLLMHVMSYLGAPYLYIPMRYLEYGIPLSLIVLLPWALHALGGQDARRSAVITLSGVAVILLLFGGRGNEKVPWTVTVDLKDRPFYDAIAALPADVLIAGWPGDEVLNNIPYLSRRNVLLNHKRHQVLHLKYMQEMRRRMDALMAAYFSSDGSAVLSLRHEFGATHLLIDTRHFTESPPEYFAPWQRRIPEAWQQVSGNSFVMQKDTLRRTTVLEHGSLVLLDLALL